MKKIFIGEETFSHKGQITPTGGIGLHNIQDYLAIPNVVACGGSWFVEKSLINGQNWQEIERLVKQAVAHLQ